MRQLTIPTLRIDIYPFDDQTEYFRRRLSRAMVFGNFGVLLIWQIVEQGPSVLAVCAGKCRFWIYFSFL